MPLSMNHPDTACPDVPDALKAVFMAVGELTQWNGEHSGVRGKEVAGKIGLKKYTASRHIKKALEVGLVVNKEPREGAPQKLALAAQLQPSAISQCPVATPRLQEGCNPDATDNCQGNKAVARLQPECNPGPAMPEHIFTCAGCSFHEYQGPNPAHGWGHCTLKDKWCYALRPACEGCKQR